MTTAIACVELHPCHATSCPREVPAGMLMCRRHWRMVPLALQREIPRLWDRHRLTGAKLPVRYFAAVREAVASVARQEAAARPQQELTL